MPATNQNVIHWQGNTRDLVIGPVTDLQGNFVDLTAALQVRWWLAKRATSIGADIFVMKELTTPGELDLTSVGFPLQWSVTVHLLPDDTENVPTGNWYHELEVIDNAGRVFTATVGTFTVKPVLIPSDLDVP